MGHLRTAKQYIEGSSPVFADGWGNIARRLNTDVETDVDYERVFQMLDCQEANAQDKWVSKVATSVSEETADYVTGSSSMKLTKPAGQTTASSKCYTVDAPGTSSAFLFSLPNLHCMAHVRWKLVSTDRVADFHNMWLRWDIAAAHNGAGSPTAGASLLLKDPVSSVNTRPHAEGLWNVSSWHLWHDGYKAIGAANSLDPLAPFNCSSMVIEMYDADNTKDFVVLIDEIWFTPAYGLGPGNGRLMMRWDDGLQSQSGDDAGHVINACKVAQEYGYRITIPLCIDQMPSNPFSPDYNPAAYISIDWDVVARLANAGHEFMIHFKWAGCGDKTTAVMEAYFRKLIDTWLRNGERYGVPNYERAARWILAHSEELWGGTMAAGQKLFIDAWGRRAAKHVGGDDYYNLVNHGGNFFPRGFGEIRAEYFGYAGMFLGGGGAMRRMRHCMAASKRLGSVLMTGAHYCAATRTSTEASIADWAAELDYARRIGLEGCTVSQLYDELLPNMVPTDPTLHGTRVASIEGGIVAVTPGAQGDGALTEDINLVVTCATASDAVTLPSADFGARVIIYNSGAQILEVWPASGDSIDGGGVDAASTIPAGEGAVFDAMSQTVWNKRKTYTTDLGSLIEELGQPGKTGSAALMLILAGSNAANDDIPLPPARAGLRVIVRNDSGNIVDVDPEAADQIDGGGVGVVVNLADGAALELIASDDVNWHSV